MRAAETAVGAVLVGAVVIICCAGPLLIAAIGATVLAAWLSYSGYALIAAVLITAASGVLWFRYSRSKPEALKASKHERLLRATKQSQGL